MLLQVGGALLTHHQALDRILVRIFVWEKSERLLAQRITVGKNLRKESACCLGEFLKFPLLVKLYASEIDEKPALKKVTL